MNIFKYTKQWLKYYRNIILYTRTSQPRVSYNQVRCWRIRYNHTTPYFGVELITLTTQKHTKVEGGNVLRISKNLYAKSPSSLCEVLQHNTASTERATGMQDVDWHLANPISCGDNSDL
ncbi:Hypothetical_protein [Hexamita inflata]|uniref:Hypothetical_protein n=1 Tax=Hexamita inflata TaxID=28002 RepID=A0AA86PRZ9_9EUKA|nr:Hypothetical protein HINF_LOCUS31331 [Hexamita inflata]